MSVVVTGGGGFLGGHLVDQLLERGESVRVLGRREYPRLQQLGVDCVRLDIRDHAAVNSAVAGCETIFHTAAVPGVWGSWKHYHSINTVGTQNVLDAALANGVTRLIYTSSPSVIYDGCEHKQADESLPYPEGRDYLCHYPHTKAIAERAVLEANGRPNANEVPLTTCALRPHLIWGPRDNHLLPRLIEKAKRGRLRVVGDRTNLVSMAYVENVASAHLQAADRLTPDGPVGGQAYFINEAEPIRLWERIDEFLAAAGLPPVRKSISAKTAYRAGAVLEGVWKTLRLGGEPPMTRFVAQQLATSHHYSIAKAERDFGYTPPISMSEAMARTAPDLKRFAKG